MSAEDTERPEDSGSRGAPSEIGGSGAAIASRSFSAGDLPEGYREERPAILLVDDRIENLFALESLLESLPVRLVRALSAADALERVEEEQFALILLDVQMPGTDGIEAARLIKARERGAVVPILFITAQDRDRRRVTTAYEAGAVDYLFKPVDTDELRAKVAAFLDLHHLHAMDRDRRRRYADLLVSVSEDRYRLAAESAQRALAAAEAADHSKAEFLSRMSHELRTPLNAILGYVQLLDLGILGAVTPEQHAHLNRVRQSAVHLLGLVNEILDLANLDSDQLRVEHVVGMLREACDEALSVVRIEAVLRNLTVVGPPPTDHGATYVGDPDRVRQVLVHLLTNAVKFTPPGGRVVLSCGTTAPGATPVDAPSEGSWAFVRVADTGPGIGAVELANIFDPFTQLDGGLTRAHEGAGLGLTISRRLARAMGGDVTVRSTAGNGASFTLWLPAFDPRAQSAPHAATKPRAREAPSVVAPPSESAPAKGRLSPSASPASSRAFSPATYQRLTALGTALTTGIESIAQEHAARLRSESLPNVDGLPEAQLRDHVSTFVNEIALVLRLTGETEARAPELLRDGSEILRLVSELHGAQREHLDWTEEHVEREIALLSSGIDQHLAAAAAHDGSDGYALEQAMLLIQRLLERSRQASFHGFRLARRGRSGTPPAANGGHRIMEGDGAYRA